MPSVFSIDTYDLVEELGISVLQVTVCRGNKYLINESVGLRLCKKMNTERLCVRRA